MPWPFVAAAVGLGAKLIDDDRRSKKPNFY